MLERFKKYIFILYTYIYIDKSKKFKKYIFILYIYIYIDKSKKKYNSFDIT